MALTNIEYGSVASSEVMNSNFQYLDDKIGSVSQSLSANTTTLSSSIASLSATVSNNKNEVNEKFSEIDEIFKTASSSLDSCLDRVYVKESYKSDKNWYRLYSDSWIEQGGYVAFTQYNDSKVVTLFKEMADLNGSIIATPNAVRYHGEWDIGIAGGRFVDTKTIKLTCGRVDDSAGAYWRVCGYVKE